MDYIFTPWRYAYIKGGDEASKNGCIFCEKQKSTNDKQSLIVHRGEHCFVILNAFPYTSGHVMIIPNAHVDELQKLDPAAATEMMSLSQKMEGVLRQLYAPDGINL